MSAMTRSVPDPVPGLLRLTAGPVESPQADVTSRVAAIAASVALAQSPALTGETLRCGGTTCQPTTSVSGCTAGGTATIGFGVTGGEATGAYTGTFTETGTVTAGPLAAPPGAPAGLLLGTIQSLSANFTIETATGTVTGHKQLLDPVPSVNHFVLCSVGNPTGKNVISGATLCYTARLPDGTIDRGTSTIAILAFSFPLFTETFTSDPSVGSCGASLPVSKDECKNGGWEAFGVFKNQGDCVSFVATQGKNEPGQNSPRAP